MQYWWNFGLRDFPALKLLSQQEIGFCRRLNSRSLVPRPYNAYFSAFSMKIEGKNAMQEIVEFFSQWIQEIHFKIISWRSNCCPLLGYKGVSNQVVALELNRVFCREYESTRTALLWSSSTKWWTSSWVTKNVMWAGEQRLYRSFPQTCTVSN